eukprot:CAMPEP_0178912996 /NCGR_PEP_ID=MMETSP0786-20121207/10588_1 /TAXON_ID=186022 /ORGANISM="Thalassionema frauenfeldii, Strain CCMP 1798" /LENGTH=324 /DNA_ID=CAMNT_0020585671 /DNA_START=78 /DNA_END=1052 /DNA_ORIENTATION=+
MTSGKMSRPRRKERNSMATTLAKVATGVGSFAGILLASQALYVFATTPCLPPPDNSGHRFEEDGLVVTNYGTNDARKNGKNEHRNSGDEINCFNLVLIGDSPVEGVGNKTHSEALGGRTAQAFSNMLRKPVRYWSFGKSGLTADGIRVEMTPLLRKTARKYDIHAIVVSCGVNNVLKGDSAALFGKELDSLIDSITASCPITTSIIMLELIDFAYLPFLPWPLSKLLSWRSTSLQKEMKAIVDDREVGRNHVEIASLPKISDFLNDSSNILFDHMKQEEKDALQLSDFYADDNFHPAGHGNIIAGKIIANTYRNMKDQSALKAR